LFEAGKENNAMEATTNNRLNPLLTAAAISVTVLSAVGVAALTGMIPASKGQESVLQIPRDVIKPIEPAISHPPARKSATRKATPPQVEPAVYSAPVGQLAVVESIREVKEPGDAKGLGAVAGGVVGGVLGNKLGKGKGLVTVLGAAGGAFAGHQIEKQARAEKRWEIAVRLDDGSQRTLSSEVQPAWHAGDRVRLVDGQLQRV
jgi:outer membrane lipoprotein SlyB